MTEDVFPIGKWGLSNVILVFGGVLYLVVRMFLIFFRKGTISSVECVSVLVGVSPVNFWRCKCKSQDFIDVLSWYSFVKHLCSDS